MVKISETDRVWEVLETVPDPEIPVLSVVDLGVIRKVEFENSRLVVTITPTYSGCPAMEFIEREVKQTLVEAGFKDVEIATSIHPAWTTDWMSESGRQKLFEYGISPPDKTTSDKSLISGNSKTVICPNCKSSNTALKSQFGSTPCKSMYVCSDCLEPFDHFKCI
jgi:ring-1,2-phenylacetyl-CoA epoxidase subunit PaaD